MSWAINHSIKFGLPIPQDKRQEFMDRFDDRDGEEFDPENKLIFGMYGDLMSTDGFYFVYYSILAECDENTLCKRIDPRAISDVGISKSDWYRVLVPHGILTKEYIDENLGHYLIGYIG